jgi:putative FmdB family regulatory protein
MPTYDFECEPCAYYTEIFQHVNDPNVHQCPVCEQQTLKKIFISPPLGFVRGEARTIGHQAERNTEKMGHYELQDKRAKDRKGTKLTEKQKQKRAQHQKIQSMTEEQKVRYIQTGKTK